MAVVVTISCLLMLSRLVGAPAAQLTKCAGIMLEGDVRDVTALDQPLSLFSPRKATRMSP